jgi:UDP-N-acetylmuramate--alanine ligase
LGRHNVFNALASAGIAYLYGIRFGVIKKALFEFNGVKRRNEYIGKLYNAKVYADYAHHPTEIKATLDMVKPNESTLVVFQPHTYSRTKILMQDFVRVFSSVKNLVVYKTYSAREQFDPTASAEILSNNLKSQNIKTTYAEDYDKLEQILVKNSNGNFDRIIVLGAGDVYEDVKKIVDKYKDNKKNTTK